MRKFKHVLLTLFLLLGLMATTAVFADEGGDDTHAAETHEDGHEEDGHADDAHGDDHAVEVTTTSAMTTSEDGNFAVGFTLMLLGLVLFVIFAVAIISAAALGIIGLGYWQSSSGD